MVSIAVGILGTEFVFDPSGIDVVRRFAAADPFEVGTNLIDMAELMADGTLDALAEKYSLTLVK